jgi:chromosome segregation ATPase
MSRPRSGRSKARRGELGRTRRAVNLLSESLKLAQDRVAELEGALAASVETHEQDSMTIGRLETELSRRADLFETLKAQISTLTDTLKAGGHGGRDPRTAQN